MKVQANGKTFDFPAGTSEADIGSALDEYFSGSLSPAKAAEKEAPMSAPAAEEGPGFFGRAYDTAVNTASDMMTSLSGGNVAPEVNGGVGNISPEMVAAFGNPNDSRSPAENVQTAVSQGIRGAGSVAMDAALTAGQEVLGDEVSGKIASGFNSVMESAPAKAIGSAIDSASEAIGPDASRRVGELVDMAAVGLPKAKVPGQGTRRVLGQEAKKLRDSQASKNKGRRRDKVEAMMEPEDGYGRGETELNALGTSRYTPTPDEAEVVNAVNELPGIKPDRSLRYNEAVVAKAARKEVEDVTQRINRAGNPEVDTAKLNNEISDAFVNIEKDGFPMTGDIQKSAETLIERARKFIEDSDGTANGVLQARRDFDTWARKNKPSVYNPDAESAVGIASKAIRKAMNDHVDALVPSAKVKPSLEKTHRLMRAKDELRPRAAKTAKTKLGRFFEKMRGHMPTTPLAQVSTAGAAWMAVTQPWVAALAILGGTAYAGGKAVQYGSKEWRGLLSKVVSGMEKTLKQGEAPAKLLADIRADKAMLVDMLHDEQMHKGEEE